ncbi:MAG: hypothetical protein HGB21_16925 [Nitrospirae bacterium]|nr:hypothetical protein [Nitrospirota bacterium]
MARPCPKRYSKESAALGTLFSLNTAARRRFNASSMTPRYYYRDEQESLPSSLQRPVKIENCAYNAVSDSYPPEVIAANGSRFYNDADSNTWSRQLRPWRSNYFSFMPSNSQFFLVWADGKTGQRNYYATVGVRGGDVRPKLLTHN